MDRKILWKNYYEKNKERLKEKARNWYRQNPEEAKERRRRWYRLHGAANRKKNIDRVRAVARKYANKYNKEHPELMYARNHSEENKARQARYRLRHKEEITKRNVEYQRKKRVTNINFRLGWLLRSRTIIAIKKQLGTKAYKSMELLGCSIQEAREHIEKQFKDNMNWSNNGTVWEIDHIQPVAAFDLTKPEEQKKAFHYTNLQPLYKLENRKKGAKIISSNVSLFI